MRSYTWSDHFSGYFTETRVFYVVLESGRTLWRYESLPPSVALPDWAKPDWAWFTRSYPIGSFEIPGVHGGWSTRFGFVIKSVPNWKHETISSIVLPYWFLVLASGSLSMSFRMRWPLRFTLRSLFVVTTFLAVVLGMSRVARLGVDREVTQHMMFRHWRIQVSLICFTLFLAVIVLWVRSYSWNDRIWVLQKFDPSRSCVRTWRRVFRCPLHIFPPDGPTSEGSWGI